MRSLRLPLALLLAALSPGFSSYEAFAGGMKSAAGPTAPSIPGAPGAGLAPIPVLAGSLIPRVDAQRQNVPPPIALGGPLEAVQAPEGALPIAPLQAVQQTIQGIERDPGRSAGLLDRLFAGGPASGPGSVDGGSGQPTDGLAPFSLSDVEAVAADRSKPRAERSAAVKTLARRADASAQAALERVGTGSASTDADDYEVKREALRALAELGKVVSLPAISRAHADLILKDLAGAKKPEAAAFDYDSTLEPSGSEMTAQTHDALKALAKSGVETMIVTDRSRAGRWSEDRGDIGMHAMTRPDDSADYTVATNRGAEVFGQYNGWSNVVPSAPTWTDAELVALRAAAAQMSKTLEVQDVDADSDLKRHDFILKLPQGLSDAEVDAAAARMREFLRLGQALVGKDFAPSVTPRYARDERPPTLAISKYDKSLAIRTLRGKRDYFVRHRDFWRKAYGLRGLAKLLPNTPVPASAVLIVGDHFFGPSGIDSDMIKGAPGALAISVGGTADPRLENVFVWPARGHEASMELAKAASGPAPAQMEGLDKKAAFGLFSSRSLSIVVFLGTTLAHAGLALKVLNGDGAAFGTLGAVGAMAAIAAGPMMGRVADKLSPAKGMTINLAMRGLFLLHLPLFALLGMLNFWTLMLGSVANGFLLSSIMTSEGTYLRRLFGFKNLGTMNSLLQLNYFFLQIVFGLILAVGKLVDGHNLMIPFYIASAVNFALIPLVRATMPNTTAAQEAGLAPASAPRVSLGRRLAAFRALPEQLRKQAYSRARRWARRGLASAREFLRKDWKQAALLAAALASFPLLGSALPIAAALLFWITRTQGFAAIKADKPILKAIGLLFMGGFMLYSMQSYMLPMIAKSLAGGAFSELLGKMLGSLFLGQMISTSSLAKLPVAKLPLIGRFGFQRLIQAAVLALVGFWVFTSLIPGSLLAAGGAVALAAAMMAAAERMTDRGWLSAIGVGLSSLALPALFWSHPAFMLAGLVSFGFFLGPTSAHLFAYIQRRAPQQKMGMIFGIQSGLFNAAISLGIGSFALLTGLFNPAFPASLWAMTAAGALVGVLYFLISRTMPGLSKDLFKKKEK